MMMACMCGAQYFSHCNRSCEKKEADRKERRALLDQGPQDHSEDASHTITGVSSKSPFDRTIGEPQDFGEDSEDVELLADVDDGQDSKLREYRLLGSLYSMGEKASWTAAGCLAGIALLLFP